MQALLTESHSPIVIEHDAQPVGVADVIPAAE
jgi:hypothetical protein